MPEDEGSDKAERQTDSHPTNHPETATDRQARPTETDKYPTSLTSPHPPNQAVHGRKVGPDCLPKTLLIGHWLGAKWNLIGRDGGWDALIDCCCLSLSSQRWNLEWRRMEMEWGTGGRSGEGGWGWRWWRGRNEGGMKLGIAKNGDGRRQMRTTKRRRRRG